MAKHIKFHASPNGTLNHFAPYSSKQQVQGVKRKRDDENSENRFRNNRQQSKQNGTGVPHSTNGVYQRSQGGRPGAQPAAPAISETHRALLQARSQLPIHPHTSSIRRSLASPRHLLVLSGSTGSGKSTQVPQMLLDEDWCAGGCIAVTQPRRVAAISLAVRVAQEMGTTLGKDSRNSKVGYSVRFDENVPPRSFVNIPPGKKGGDVKREARSAMRIKYLTEGMLVQEIARDPWLKAYKCVVVDEVHERSVNVDLILGFLRRILVAQEGDDEKQGKNAASRTKGASHQHQKESGAEKSGRAGVGKLKVVIMSATADTEAIFNFFEAGFAEEDVPAAVGGPTLELNGKIIEDGLSGKKLDAVVDDASEDSWNGLSSSENDDVAKEKHKPEAPWDEPVPGETEVSSDHISTRHIEGRQYPVQIMYAPEPASDFVESALKTIFQIHYKEPLPGDILVFLTGQDTVESLEGLVREYAAAMSPELPKVGYSRLIPQNFHTKSQHQLLILPLFAALPQAAQQLVFNLTPPKTRKVILATNIAETSLTIPGIRHVIDCGLAKLKEYRSALALDSLLVKPISQSSAIQRKGRAGREAPGTCWRLYTEAEYLKLPAATVPEILRCDLAAAILTMKARGVEDVTTFPLLDRPSIEAMRKALLSLHRLTALASTGHITNIGRQMARLPLPPQLSRVLVAAASTDPSQNCLHDVIDIVACLSVESVFLPLTSEEKKEEAEAARHELYRREGDHLTLMAALQAYVAEESDRRAWCDTHFVSHRAMRNAMDVRKQLRLLCQSLKLPGVEEPGSAQVPKSSKDEGESLTAVILANADRHDLILCTLLAGFSQNVARLCPDGSYKTIEGNQTVGIHPGSVLFGRKVEAIVYNELVWTTRCWARGVSAIRLDWWVDAVGAGEVLDGDGDVEH